MSHPTEQKKAELQELSSEQLEHVRGASGTRTVLVPIEDCQVCASGIDPTVGTATFKSLLTGDL